MHLLLSKKLGLTQRQQFSQLLCGTSHRHQARSRACYVENTHTQKVKTTQPLFNCCCLVIVLLPNVLWFFLMEESNLVVIFGFLDVKFHRLLPHSCLQIPLSRHQHVLQIPAANNPFLASNVIAFRWISNNGY